MHGDGGSHIMVHRAGQDQACTCVVRLHVPEHGRLSQNPKP